MRLLLILTLSSLFLAACGGNDPAPTPDAPAAIDLGLNKPTKSLKANMDPGGNTWVELGAANLSCLGTPSGDVATTVGVTLNLKVLDFQYSTAVAGAAVVAFPDANVATPFGAPQTSDDKGYLTLTIPVGTKRFGYKMTGGFMPTFLLNQTVDADVAVQPDNSCDASLPRPCRSTIQSISNTTATLLPAVINVTRTPGTGVIAGALRDCDRHEMSNFIATVSSVRGSAMALDGADAFYFNSGVGLPARHTQQDFASSDGLFLILQLSMTQVAYVQMWGYKTDEDLAADHLTLVAELPVPVLADTVITGSYEPLRQ